MRGFDQYRLVATAADQNDDDEDDPQTAVVVEQAFQTHVFVTSHIILTSKPKFSGFGADDRAFDLNICRILCRRRGVGDRVEHPEISEGSRNVMPDTPDKNSSGFQQEGLSFSPPAGAAKPTGPAEPAKPATGPAKPAGQGAPAGSVKPTGQSKSAGTAKPAGQARPPDPTKNEPSAPVRRSVLPKGFGASAKPETAPSSNAPAVTPDTAVFKRPNMPSVQPEKQKPTDKKSGRLISVTMQRRPRAFTGLLAGILYVIVVLSLAFVLGSTGWSYARDVLALQKEPATTTIEFTEGMSITELAKLLKNDGIIEYEWLFRLYCDISDAEEKIAPGKYVLEAKDYRALVNMMTPYSESRAVVTITFPEGITMDNIFQLLEENRVSTREKLEEAAATTNWKYSYLKNMPAVPTRLEGYLFPETFTFYVNESPVSVLQKFVKEFDRRLTAEMREHVKESGYTLHEIITIASLIEAEAIADEQERKNIASVIYNRLDKNERLDIDATVLYLLPEHKERLTAEDLEIDSPYNTRKYKGLPPGPICSPSIGSIRAALYPNKTKYMFYALHKDGAHRFFNTLDGFNEFISSGDFAYND